jgi:hypothetical protein
MFKHEHLRDGGGATREKWANLGATLQAIMEAQKFGFEKSRYFVL